MKLLNSLFLPQANPLVLKKESLRQNFCRDLTSDEVKSLHNYDTLHQKVLVELKGSVDGAEEMTARLKGYLENNTTKYMSDLKQVYVPPGSASVENVPVSLLNPKTWLKSSWTYQNETPVLTSPGVDLNPIVAKLNKAYGNFGDKGMFIELRDELRSDQCHTKLDAGVYDHYIQGIQNCDLVTWPRLSESVTQVSVFIKNQLSMSEVSTLLEYCISNEKFIFILIYPFFIQPLKKILWSYLYPIFSLTKGSFTYFLKQVALKIGNIINNKSASINGFHHLKVSRVAKFTLGTGLSSLLLLYNKSYFQSNMALIPLHTGMGGFLGQFAGEFRLNGSKFIYEITKTASTFSNAAVAGFLEPKQDAVRYLVKSITDQRR